MTRHRLTVEKFRHAHDGDPGQKRTAQVGHQRGKSGLQTALPQNADHIGFLEMVQGQVAHHNVDRFIRCETYDVRPDILNLGKVPGEFLGDAQGCLLPVDRGNRDGTLQCARFADNRARKIPAAGGQIQNAQRLPPAQKRSQLFQHHAAGAETVVERLEIAQISFQFGRRGLRHIHPLRLRGVELPDHGCKASTASMRPVCPRSTR